MVRLILLFLLLALSLLTVFRAPTNGLWYLSIAVTEFPWIFASLVILLLLWPWGAGPYYYIAMAVGAITLVLLAVPVVSAYKVSAGLEEALNRAFAQKLVAAEERRPPFQLSKMISGIGAKEAAYKTLRYKEDAAQPLTLDFYPAHNNGDRPCVIVVHGGSWAGGNSRQLPELNTYLANKGYHVAAINYRLAPAAVFPAPVQDVQAAIAYLFSNAAQLGIDTGKLILLGRSAGAQVALTAAYTQNGNKVKGVIAFYGPADMVWGYGNPASKLIMDSRKVMEDYLGGTYQQVPQQYTQSAAIATASPQAPPTLLIHGKNDPLVAYEHSIRLSKVLTRHQVPHYLLTLPWATHGCDYTLNGPSGQLSTYAVERFLQFITK